MNNNQNNQDFETDASNAMEKAVRSTLYDSYSLYNNYTEAHNIDIYKLTTNDSIDLSCIYCALKVMPIGGSENIMLLGFSKEVPNRILENYGFHNVKDQLIINDCIEEISSIIGGKLKKILTGSGYNVAIKLPELVENKTEFENKYGLVTMKNNNFFCIK